MQHPVIDDEYVQCRVTLIKWLTNYAHVSKKQTGEGSIQLPSMSSIQSTSGGPTSTSSMGSQQVLNSLTSHSEESEQSFTVSTAGDIYRGSLSNEHSITHPSLDSGFYLSSYKVMLLKN